MTELVDWDLVSVTGPFIIFLDSFTPYVFKSAKTYNFSKLTKNPTGKCCYYLSALPVLGKELNFSPSFYHLQV